MPRNIKCFILSVVHYLHFTLCVKLLGTEASMAAVEEGKKISLQMYIHIMYAQALCPLSYERHQRHHNELLGCSSPLAE